MESQDKWLTIEEFSGYLKMSRSKLYQMAPKGDLPVSRSEPNGDSTETRSMIG